MNLKKKAPASIDLVIGYSLTLFFSLFFSLAYAETITGRVVGISDGDTVTILDTFSTQYKVRLMGIDAPEKKQEFGSKAKKHLSDLIFGKIVTVEWFKRDRYNRILGKVLIDGRDVNLEQIRAGYAWHFKRYQEDQSPIDRKLYSDAEEESRRNRIGLWIDPSPVVPSEFRANPFRSITLH